MTRFICQELLYEFATGRLDAERQKDMDSYLTGCRDSQRELERLKKGLRFARQCQQLRVTEELLQALNGFEPQWKRRLHSGTEWLSSFSWKALPYAFLLGALTLGLVVSKPWRQMLRPETTLVEQIKTEPDMFPPVKDVKVAVPEFAGATKAPDVTPAPAPAVAPPAPQPAAKVEAKAAPVKAEPQEAPEAPSSVEEKAALSPQRSLTRGEMEVSDFNNSAKVIREKIIALGGKAAGNVELGWQRNKGESYFHFSLPESNQQELEVFLKTFGPVRFVREPHPRVMPEGQIRIILTIKGWRFAWRQGRDRNPVNLCAQCWCCAC